LNANFTALRDQVATIVKNAVFNGFNLVDGSTTQVTALASSDGTRRIVFKVDVPAETPARAAQFAKVPDDNCKSSKSSRIRYSKLAAVNARTGRI
jgi:flagellin